VQFPVKNTKGEVVGQMELSDQVYGAPLNADLLHQVMVHHQGNQRQGTSSTKTRGEVSGGGRKPFAQKHTGRARMGSTRSPLARHGGVTFGPRPRSYRTSLPKKMRRQAIRCVLSAKVAQSRVVVLENMDFAAGKTKEMAAVLQALSVTSSALVVTPRPERNVSLGVRNISRVKTLTADLLNVLDLLRYDMVVMSVEAAERTNHLWSTASVPVAEQAVEVTEQEEEKATPAPAPKRAPRRRKEASSTA
jgi:large subunit ribosomal protein L4